MILSVHARANHPTGYGWCSGVNQDGRSHQINGPAHGYVVVVVRCESWDEVRAVRDRLAEQPYDRSGERPEKLPGFDPWRRGDEWYAGPYEMVWAAEVEGIGEVRGMYDGLPPIAVGDRPSYGDNRAMAYLDAAEVLGQTSTDKETRS